MAAAHPGDKVGLVPQSVEARLSMSEKNVVAVVGLGRMGTGMAHSLLRAGFPVPRLTIARLRRPSR